LVLIACFCRSVDDQTVDITGVDTQLLVEMSSTAFISGLAVTVFSFLIVEAASASGGDTPLSGKSPHVPQFAQHSSSTRRSSIELTFLEFAICRLRDSCQFTFKNFMWYCRNFSSDIISIFIARRFKEVCSR
jgi:hypothetical protein